MKPLTRILHLHWKLLPVPEDLFEAIQSIAEADGLTPCELVAWLVTREEAQRQASHSMPARWQRLTPREQEIVLLVRDTLSNEMIADRLGISPHTVKAHVIKALSKLGLHSRYQVKEALEGFDFTPPVEGEERRLEAEG